MRSTALIARTFLRFGVLSRVSPNNKKMLHGEDKRVIRLDLARLSRAEIEHIVTERCSKFGSVVAVVIVQDGAHYDFALASVEMSTRAEAIELLRHLGESLVDDAVVIRLEQAL